TSGCEQRRRLAGIAGTKRTGIRPVGGAVEPAAVSEVSEVVSEKCQRHLRGRFGAERGSAPEAAVEPERPDERLRDRLVDQRRHLAAELQLAESLCEDGVFAGRYAGLSRKLEDALGDRTLAGRDNLRRSVARVAQSRRHLARLSHTASPRLPR